VGHGADKNLQDKVCCLRTLYCPRIHALTVNLSRPPRASQILRTPLHWACTQGNVPVIEYLISVGADITIQNTVSRSLDPSQHFCIVAPDRAPDPMCRADSELIGEQPPARLLQQQRAEGEVRRRRTQESRYRAAMTGAFQHDLSFWPVLREPHHHYRRQRAVVPQARPCTGTIPVHQDCGECRGYTLCLPYFRHPAISRTLSAVPLKNTFITAYARVCVCVLCRRSWGRNCSTRRTTTAWRKFEPSCPPTPRRSTGPTA
jgi:hypothetical protein